MTTIYINDGLERELILTKAEQTWISEYLGKWGYNNYGGPQGAELDSTSSNLQDQVKGG